MYTKPNDAVLDYIISMAYSRFKHYNGAIPKVCEESVAIFDELDSLPAEDFSSIYALYLVGSGVEDNTSKAEKIAQSAEFSPLEAITTPL